MNNKKNFEFEIDEPTATIKVKRIFDAPLSIVWDAWTKSEFLDQWWAPEGYTSTTKSMTFEEGGSRHYHMAGPDQFEMWGLTTYDKIKLKTMFSGQELSADENGHITNELSTSNYQITFYSAGEQTSIYHETTYENMDGLKQSLEYGFKEGMLGAFERLDSILKK